MARLNPPATLLKTSHRTSKSAEPFLNYDQKKISQKSILSIITPANQDRFQKIHQIRVGGTLGHPTNPILFGKSKKKFSKFSLNFHKKFLKSNFRKNKKTPRGTDISNPTHPRTPKSVQWLSRSNSVTDGRTHGRTDGRTDTTAYFGPPFVITTSLRSLRSLRE